MKHIDFPSVPNFNWRRWIDEGSFTIPKNPLINQSDRVFTIGSCFAREVRKALINRQVHCLPDYAQVTIDDTRYVVDQLPHELHMNYYNTFTIRQEFERCIGAWQPSSDDIWEIKDPFWNGGTAYQDPYRRAVFARTPEDLSIASEMATKQITKGFQDASAVFITLGLVEVWRKKNNGKFACQEPGYQRGGGADETEFHLSTFSENFENLTEIVSMVRQHKKRETPIVVTVSPVPLGRTWSSKDVFEANVQSKATLRAVAGEVAGKFDNVTYFPSYEIALALGANAFEVDGRHVRPQVVGHIMDAFLKAHFYT